MTVTTNEFGQQNMFAKYLKFIKDFIRPLFNNETLVYQKVPTFRVHLDNNVSVGEVHKDSDYGHAKNEEIFVDHRHDQSIFSLLVKRDTPFFELSDETYLSKEEWEKKSKDFPIWTTRNRGFKLFKSIVWS